MGHMYRGQEIRSLESDRRFNPALLSNPEVEFVGEHIGKSPGKAMTSDLNGAQPGTVRPLLEFFFDMIEEGTVTFIGVEAFRAKLAPWKERCELIKETKAHNHGAQFPVELYAKQGSRYVRGGRGSDFGGIRRYAFDFIDDAMPGTLEDALDQMAGTAKDNLEAHAQEQRDKEAKRTRAEEAGILSSDRMVDGQLLFDDTEPGRIKCIAPDCGYQKDYVEEAGDIELPRRKAIKALSQHCAYKVKHNDLDEEHTRIMFGLKEG